MVASVRIMYACSVHNWMKQSISSNTTVLTAVQEVDNAMSSYKNSIQTVL